MKSDEPKVIRLVEYLTRLAALRAKVIRDVNDYSQLIWLSDIPHEKNCYTRAWGPNDEYDDDIWVEIQTSHEPALPPPPEVCEDWIDPYALRNTNDFPSLKDTTTIPESGNRSELEQDSEQLPLFKTLNLEDNPHIQSAWDRYLEQKWLPWAEEHQKWQRVHDIYTKFFTIYQEQLRLGEEYELILALGLLSWHTQSNQRIRRHLIVGNASLEFEARLGKFTVRPNPDGTNLRPELDMLDIDDQPLRGEEIAVNGLAAASDNPWDKDCIEGVLKALIHSISPDGEYHDSFETGKLSISKKAVLEYSPALILRKRSVKGLTETLRAIKKRIVDGEVIPPQFGDLAEIDKKEGQITLDEDIGNDAKLDDVEIYFPKPSNDEQIRIVEKIQHSTGVLVQGPPGTGKSHSIANLICHLLATGQRTLVTAKTPRALKVIEHLLHEKLRPLCINLLGTGLEEKKSLESSVRAILTKNEEWHEESALRQIKELEKRLYELRNERATTQNILRLIRESETFSQTVSDGAYTGTPSKIAQAVDKGYDSFGWFEDKIANDIKLPFSQSELGNILRGLRILTEDKRKELNRKLPDSFLSTEEFRELVSEETKAKEEADKAKSFCDEGFLESISQLPNETILSIQRNIVQLRNEIYRLKSLSHKWISKALQDIALGDSSIWSGLYQITEEAIKNIKTSIQTADDTSLIIPENLNPRSVLADAIALKEYFESGGKLGWGPFRSKAIKPLLYISKEIKVNENLCNNLDCVTALAESLKVSIEMEKAWQLWSEFADRTSGSYSLQFRQLESLKKALYEVLAVRSKASLCTKHFEAYAKAAFSSWHDENRLQSYIQTCAFLIAKLHFDNIITRINSLESSLIDSAAQSNAHPVINAFLESVRLRDIDKYAQAVALAEKLRREKNSALWIDKSISALRKLAPDFVNNLIANINDDCWDTRIKQLPDAWKWSQARKWLEDYILRDDSSSLENRLNQIENDIGNIIGQIASLRAWSFCFSRMEEHHRRHMEAWQQSIRKLGKGTGKHAPRHRREAQKHLNECRDAVPAWVMPLHRIWDTVNPAPGMFDLIIIDEASQCGFEALPLFYLGKKILIVGDDKQISPDAVGVPRDAVHRLMEEYLHDYQFKDSFDVESSLFDHGKLRYGTRRIALREHFRCMPEIIKFSNDLCYSDTPLIPLRQYGTKRLPPIEHFYLSNGYREGSYSRVINRPEAEMISEKIAEICSDERYVEKSIGVIVLQGDAQARLIEEQLLTQIGAEEIEKRKIICGNPYSFQGDERDIIFLSMVAAPNERIGPLTKTADERRFNVAASRAKDQMLLCHSVKKEDLSASCLRRRLLDFFEGNNYQPILGIDIEDLERQAYGVNRSIVKPPAPFDSWFEVDVALMIARKGYQITPQFEVAGKRIDLVVEGGQSRLAVECDGDEFHTADEYEQDMDRQRILMRCGWDFFRVRASSFYANREKSLDDLWRMLDERGICPNNGETSFEDDEEQDAAEKESDEEEVFQHEEEIKNDYIEIGDTVIYANIEDEDAERQVMISRAGSNPDLGIINKDAPIARAFLGAKVDDVVEATLPLGVTKFRIKRIDKGNL